MNMHATPSALDPDRDPVDVLAEEFAARIRRGETPAISEYVGRFPEHTEQIRQLFPSIALLEQLGSQGHEDRHDSSRRTQERLLPHHQIGDFEILREIGRGGMGVVYEALQHSLQRLVALKVLNDTTLHSDKQGRRFEREARAAAQLHHTNIVPVFGVGEHGGHRYYVMQRIHGLGLDAVLAELARQIRQGSSRQSAGGDGTPEVSAGHLVDVLISGELSTSRSGNAACYRHSEALLKADSLPSGSQDMVDVPADPGGSVAETLFFVQSSLVLQDGDPEPLPAGIPTDPVQNPGVALQSSGDTSRRSSKALDSSTQVRANFGKQYWRNVARIGVQIASGLQYAHSQGTLHRDIKPANILLDTDGTAWIADFGLAKVLEADDVTRTGDIVGTLRYMAPEQFRGESDVRSDIYSLGLTLYELLAVGPAYNETDRQQLIAHKLTPHDLPSLLKRFPELPRDLETIVFKCLAYEAHARYASAGAVLGDLQAFLEDRPIRARQVSSVERLWRWCRRNPLVAGLSGTVAALLLLTAGLTSFGYISEQRLREVADADRRAAITERAKAVAERTKAERIADVAFEAFDALGQSFVSDDPTSTVQLNDEDSEEELRVPVYSPETAALMEQVRSAFDQLADVAGTDDRFRDYAAKADMRAGELHLRLAQWAEAEAAFSRAIELTEQSDFQVDDAAARLRLAKLYNGLGMATAAQRHRDESHLAHQQAMALLKDDLSQPEEYFELARTHFLLGRRSLSPDLSGERPPDHGGHRGPDGRRSDENRLRGEPPHPPRPDHQGASPWRGGIQIPRGHREEELSHLQIAAQMFTQLTDSDPSNPDYQFWLAQCHLESSVRRPGEQVSNEDQRMTAITILEGLVRAKPDEPDYLHRLSEAYEQSYREWSPGWRGLIELDADRTWGARPADRAPQVEEDLRKAWEVSESLVQLQPHVPGYAMSHLLVSIRLVDVLQSQGQAQQARKILDQAIAECDSASQRFPEMDHFTEFLEAVMQHQQANLLMAEENYSAASEVLQSLIARMDDVLSESSVDRGPRLRAPREIILPVYRRLILCYEALGRDEEADQLRSNMAELLKDGRNQRRREPRRSPPNL